MVDKTVIIKLDVQEAGAISSIESLNNSLKGLDKTSDEYAAVLKNIQTEESRLASIQSKRAKVQSSVSKSQKTVTKALRNQSDATGSATAATMELSRVVSDAPYGIRGMANNITQLVSQLGTASTKAGGLTGALKLMWKALKGPLGVVFAITAVVSALDFFYGANKKVEKSTDELVSSLDVLANAFEKKVNVNIKEYIALLKQKTALDLSLKKSTEEITAVEEKLAWATNQRIIREKVLKKAVHNRDLKQKLLNQASEFELRLQQKLENLYRDAAESINEYKKAKEELTAADKASLRGLKQEKTRLEAKRELLSKTSDKYKELTIDIDNYQKKIEEIEGKKKKGGKSKKISPFKTGKELELDIKSNLSAIDKLQRSTEIQNLKNKEKEELSLAKTEEGKLRIKESYASKNLEIQLKYELKALDLKATLEKTAARSKQAEFVKGLDEKLEAYKKSFKVESEASKKAIALATTETEAKKKLSEEKLRLTVSGIEEEYAKLFPFWVELADARRNALGIGTDEGEEDSIKKWFNKYAFHAEQAKALISGVADFVDSEFERELAIEQNKTNAINNELNKRLLNENLSKDQKKAIQLQISQNDERLRIRQEQIARKRFKVMKAFNLATALTDTYLATQKAYLSQLQLDPTSPIRAKIAAGIALASGLANVAAIARTKFESSSGSSPLIGGGGGGGGNSRSEPSFNIVGRSNDNLLLNAIQSQFDQPLRAYVVARDVTNQQQLDGIITNAAGT